MNKESLPPILYSWVWSRIIHYICSICLWHPNTKIFLYKVDLDAAYRWCHLSSSTEIESMTIYDHLLLFASRMTFGGSPCPALWGYIAETLADTCNALILNPYWDHNLVYDQLSDTVDDPLPLPDSIPCHPALPLSVPIPSNDLGKVDIARHQRQCH